MMKKLFLAMSVAALSVGAFARGCPPGGWHPEPHPHHYPHDRGGWGRGGCNFWPSFVGGVVGAAVGTAIANSTTTTVTPAPVVVQQPVVVTSPTVVQQPVVQQQVVVQPVTTTQNVWVEGRYIDTVQANGTVLRTWEPGHYEQRTVVVQ